MGDLSYADIAAMTGNSGFGNGIIDLAALSIFANGGFGFGMNNRGNVATTEDLASGFNFQALQNKGNETLAAIQATNQNLSNAVCQLGYQSLEQSKSLSQQLSNCCCENLRALDGVNYNVGQQSAAVMANDTANSQKILDKLCAMESAQKDATIAAQGREIDQLRNDLRFCRLPVVSNVGWTVNPVPGCTPNCGGVTMG